MEHHKTESEYGCIFEKLRLLSDPPARVVLYILSFTGFIVSYMMRTDINIAIVAMAKTIKQPSQNSLSEAHYCYNSSVNLSVHNIKSNEEGEFDWDPFIQTTIIGSFYWCYVLTQVVGGILAQKYGPKATFGFGQLITAISSLCIPFVANVHYSLIIFLRCLQGAASGVTWPAMFALSPRWIPPSERSRFMSSFQGISIGVGIVYPLAGFIQTWGS